MSGHGSGATEERASDSVGSDDWAYYGTILSFVGCLGLASVYLATFVQVFAYGFVVSFFLTPILMSVDQVLWDDDILGLPWGIWPLGSVLAYIVVAPVYIVLRFVEA